MSRSRVRALGLCVAMVFSSSAFAQTWDGSGAVGGALTWSTAANWNPDGVPVNNGTANIIMAGTIDTTNTLDVSFDINSLTFDNTAGGFIINNSGGVILTVRGGGITNNDTQTQGFTMPLALAASQTWNAAAGGFNFGGTGSVNLNANTLTLTGANNQTFTGPISGATGSITINTTGNVILANAGNSFGGTTTLNSGSLLLGNVNVLGSSALTIAGGTVQSQTIATSHSNAVSVAGNFSVGGSLALTLSGAMTLTGNRTITVDNTASTTFSGVIGQDISGRAFTKAGAGTLTFGGAAANTFNGNTTINAGTLILQKPTGTNAIAGSLVTAGDGFVSATLRNGASNQIIDSAAVLVNHLGTYDLNGFNETVNELSMLGNASVTTGAGSLFVNNVVQATPGTGTSSISGNLNLASGTRTFSVFAGTGSLNVSAVISNGGVTKTNDGTLTFSGASANTYTGTTTVNSGTLILNKSGGAAAFGGPLTLNTGVATTVVAASSSVLPVGTPITLNSGTTLRIDSSQTLGPLTFASGGTVDLGTFGTFALFSTVTSLASSTQATMGNAAVDRLISLGGSPKTFDVADGSAPIDLLLTGTISSGRIDKIGAGTLKIGGFATNNSFAGINVNAGTVILGKSAGAGALTGNITVGDGAGGAQSDVLRLAASDQIPQIPNETVTVNASGLFDLNGFTESVGTLQLNSGVVTGGTIACSGFVSSSAAAVGSVIASNVDCGSALSIFVNDGTASEDLLISGSLLNGSFTKSNPGLLMLSGATPNTSQLDSINAGTVVMNKSPGVDAIGGGSVGVGDGAGTIPNDVLRWGGDDQVPAGMQVIVNSSGLVDLDNHSDTIGNILFNGGGAATTGTGTLTVLNTFRTLAGASTATFSGKLDLGADVLPFTVDDGTPSSDLDITAAMANGTVHKLGLGTLSLSGAALTSNVSYVHDNGEISAPTLLLGAGQSYSLNGGTFTGVLTNNGTFTYSGGAFNGQLQNNDTAVFNANFVAGNGLTNAATIVINSGRTVTLNGVGLLNDVTGTLSLAGGTINGAGTLVNSGQISASGSIGGSGGFSNALTGSVTLTGNLSLSNTGANSNAGLIAIGAKSLSLGASLINQGLITLGGGSIVGAGVLTNGAGGEIRGGSSVLAPLTNNGGVIRAVSGSVLNLSNLSGGNIGGGELRVDDAATLNVVSAFTSSGTVVLNGANSILNGGAITHSGTLRGQGRVSNVVLNTGTIRAEAGSLTLSAAGNTNAASGRIEAGAGTQVLYSLGLATNAGQISLTGGSFDNNNLPLANPGSIQGYGAIRSGGLSNTGSISVGGSMDILGAVTNNGTVSTQTGTTARFFGPVNGAGSYAGTGTAMFLNTFSPGNSPAIVNVAGNMILTGTATLEIEIGGFTPGAEHDQVNVGQSVALGGRLDITSWAGFQILPGDQFTVLTFGARIGDFSTMSFTGNTFAGLGVTRLFTANSMIVTGTGLAGDANLDGNVDFDDLLVLAQNYNGANLDWFAGDFNRSSTVTFDDLLLLAQNYGAHLLTAEQAGTIGTAFAADFLRARSLVPEPVGVVVMSAALLTGRSRRR